MNRIYPQGWGNNGPATAAQFEAGAVIRTYAEGLQDVALSGKQRTGKRS